MGQSRRSEFLRDYTAIRAAEGHGFAHANELMELPHVGRRHPHAGIWRIRQRSYDVLVRKVLPRFGVHLRILDLGAGVGWLSYRLAQLGHQPSAIDFNPDASDGLTASRHYATTWPQPLEIERLWPLCRTHGARRRLTDGDTLTLLTAERRQLMIRQGVPRSVALSVQGCFNQGCSGRPHDT